VRAEHERYSHAPHLSGEVSPMERCVVSHEVAPAKEENMSSLARECLKCADSAIFSLHLGNHRIILKGGLDAQIVTDGTTMRVAHNSSSGGRRFHKGYDFQVHTCKHCARPEVGTEPGKVNLFGAAR